MSDAKWTPGPWFAEIYSGGHRLDVWSECGSLIYHGVGLSSGLSDEMKCNAHLIASAPELAEEHRQWAEDFGAALMAVMQEDYGPITEIAMRMPFDFPAAGEPTLRSEALAKARGEKQ